MTETSDKKEKPEAGSIDYNASAAEIAKAKEKAADADAKRLAEEHGESE